MPQFGRLPTATVYISAGCGMTTTSIRYIKTDQTRQTVDIPSSKDHMQQKTHKPTSAGKRRVRNVCVYCGSNVGVNPAYATAARTLGATMAKERIGLVYGGGGLGLMGELARAVLAQGGRVTGIIPAFLSKKERMLRDADELIVV